MDNPAVLLLLLEQGNRSLVDHTRDFVHLVPLTHFPDSSLCTFYRAGLNIATKAQLSGEGPRESFADYMEWVLVSCRSSLTAEDDTSPTQDPEPSQPAPRHAEFEPEPTADDEPEPRATELKIATEPEPYTSDQCKMERVRAMESPAHCTTAGGELDDNSGDLIDFSTEDLEDNSGDLIDFSTEDLENNSGDLIDFFTEVSTCLVMPACMESPPTLPLLPMSTSVCSPLSPDSPSAHPQPTTCAVGAPRVCQLPSASGLEDPSSPPPASESRTPPQPSDPAASPRLSAPSSPSSPIGPPAPPGSLVFPAPPWSVVGPSSPQDSVPTAAPRHSVPPALWTSFLPLAQPPSSVAPAPPRTFGSPPTPRSPEPRAPPWPSGSSVSPWIFGSPSPPRAPPPAPPPAAPPPLFSTMAPPSVGSTVGRHDGCGLGLAWLLLLRVPPEFSLAPPSVVTTLDFVYCPPPGRPSATRASSHNDFIIFTPLSTPRGRAFREGGTATVKRHLSEDKSSRYPNTRTGKKRIFIGPSVVS
ncbi:Opioid growth factor receptor [Labeo rohita]|uniref:Opioid growth factor receptor n=1 Tax=Labeo rohita TaxID=84645 RepID=A0ABQ8M3P2_LABRO|nr:Opioid growth factor receptor [Labeo rohita]